MKTNNIKNFLLIEASKLATDEVNIVTWEAESPSKILELYENRKKWNDEHEEEYSTKTSFQFRRIVVYHYSGNVSTWLTDINEIKELAKEEIK